MSLRSALLDSPAQMSQVLGDGATFQNLTGNTLVIDDLVVGTIRAQELIMGTDVLPSVYYYGLTGLDAALGEAFITLPAPLYYVAPVFVGGTPVLDPLNPFLSATLVKGGIPNVPGAGYTEWPSTTLASINIGIANTQYLPSGTKNNQFDSLHLFIAQPTTSTTVGGAVVSGYVANPLQNTAPPGPAGKMWASWYVIGAPPQSSVASWGGNDPLNNNKFPLSGTPSGTAISPTTSYTSFSVTATGALGAADINGWPATAPTLAGTLCYLPYTVTQITGATTPVQNPLNNPPEPSSWVSGTPLTGQKQWPDMPGATTQVGAVTGRHPSFWVQSAVLLEPVSSGGPNGTTIKYKYINVTSTVQGQEPTTSGQGIRFQVYNQQTVAGTPAELTTFKMDFVVGNAVGTRNMLDQVTIPNIGSVSKQLLLTLGCCSNSFSLGSTRWSTGTGNEGISTSSVYNSPNMMTAPLTLICAFVAPP